MTLAELSRRVGFDKSWTSRAVEQLVQEVLVERVASIQDRRIVQLSLSSAGQERLADLNSTLNALAEQAFEHIPGEQHAMVRSSLTSGTQSHQRARLLQPPARPRSYRTIAES